MESDALMFGAVVGAAIYLGAVIRAGQKENRQALSALTEQSERIASELEDIRECLDQIMHIARDRTK
jgi:hypothetical protein